MGNILNVLCIIGIGLISWMLIYAIVFFAIKPIIDIKFNSINAEVNSIEYVLFNAYKQNYNYRIAKRTFDFIMSINLIILLSPIMTFEAVTLKIFFGKVLETKKILGYKGKIIESKIFYSPKDSACGRFFKYTKLYQTPLLFDLLKGNFTLIGLWKFGQHYDERYEKIYCKYEKPGIISLPSILSNSELCGKYEDYYLKNRGIIMDILILFGAAIIMPSE